MIILKTMDVDMIVLQAKPGAHIGHVAGEAIVLCLEYQADVQFIHNDKTYLLEYKALWAAARKLVGL